MIIELLLDGNEPTQAWLGSAHAARLLSDPARRDRLYGALHPAPPASYGPLLRAMLVHEVAWREREHDEHVEGLYWCAFLLSRLGEVRDVLELWRAKQTDFDTSIGLDVQFLVGAGVAPTLAHLAGSDDPEAKRAAEHIRACAAAGDFDDLDGWAAHRRDYFTP